MQKKRYNITNVSAGDNALQPNKIRVHKRFFSLNPFWSSPDILEFTPRQLFLIALRNACSYITVFELVQLMGLHQVEELYEQKKEYFSTKCRKYIKQALNILREEKELRRYTPTFQLLPMGHTMKLETKKVLDKIKDFIFFRMDQAVLEGGTALSLHLRHRLSEDLDFVFYDQEKLPREQIALFARRYGARYVPWGIEREIFANEGGDIDDYHQRFVIDGIKVEFSVFSGNILEKKDLLTHRDIVHINDMPVASLESLKKMKSLLLMDRNKIRDLYDVVYMIQNRLLSTGEMLDIIKSYRITYTDDHILMWINSKKQLEDDEGLDGLITQNISYEELKEYIVNEIKKEMLVNHKKIKRK